MGKPPWVDSNLRPLACGRAPCPTLVDRYLGKQFLSLWGMGDGDEDESYALFDATNLFVSAVHGVWRWCHPTSNIEDAFSSNFPDYIPASPDYVTASPGKTYSISSNNSFGLVPIASPTLSLFHDDPYIKVMHEYYSKESPIPPPTIVPPSLMLSPMFNPQEFFLPEELLPLKKRGRDRSSSSTSALPQAFEI
ncbi:hypothetical protein Tco_0984958 [Tanacetum coccineum]